MSAHLLANSLYALLLVKATAGVVGSIALVLNNPVPHLFFCIPWIVWIASREERWSLLPALLVGYLPLSLLLGIGWFMFGQNLMHAGAADAATMSSGAVGMASVFTPPDTTILLARLIGIAKTWIWAVPGAADSRSYRGRACARQHPLQAVCGLRPPHSLGYFSCP